jgi:hypothetical protein
VLAVADSDSYLKWAAAMLDGLPAPAGGPPADEVVLLASPLLPSSAQVHAAVAGTRTAAVPVEVLTLRALTERLRLDPPTALLVACTGPTAQVVLAAARRLPDGGPLLVGGLPGVALPASAEAVRWRAGIDVLVVHSPAEREAFAPIVASESPGTRVVLTRLPFLPGAAVGAASAGASDGVGAPGSVRRVVFAPQALVPAARADRVRVLDALARVAASGTEVVVKLRGRAGERQTHDERWPYDRLATTAHAALRFETGPMTRWLSPGTLLATVSSTAALEALALGLPAVLLDDVGAGPDAPGAATFGGSGLVVPVGELTDVVARGGPTVSGGWLASSPLHREPDGLPDVVTGLAPARGAGPTTVPAVRPTTRARLRVLLPVGVSRALARVRALVKVRGVV